MDIRKEPENTREELTDGIVAAEWFMFDKVNNIGGRADCQDDLETFSIMRRSFFSAFGTDTLALYARDLKNALEEGRNLITEKYAYMMEYTSKEYFDRELAPQLPAISREKSELVDKIADRCTEYEKDFAKKHPVFSRTGRPAAGTEGDVVSSQVYLTGELKTYSEETLRSLWDDILKSENSRDGNMVEKIHESTARAYGYAGVDEAEKSMSNA